MFLIIQTGDPVAKAQDCYGSFAQWFITGMGLPSEQVQIIDVHRGQALPKSLQVIAGLKGIIITGSAAMVTDRDPWLLSTQRWLNQIFQYEIPTLGVCFGHQLLADMLGGTVGYNDQGRHMGYSQCKLLETAKNDPLFKRLSLELVAKNDQFSTLVSHLQVVTALPKSATLLGSTAIDKNHVFHAEKSLWGMQFHPEWSAEIMSTYIEARKPDLLAEGFSPDTMIAELQPCHDAYSLLNDFTQLALNFKA
ncbi:MAG: glutamine amidotransferase [Marinicella sp.]